MAVSYTYVKNQICNQLGEEYLEQSPLEQGADSLQFLESSTKNDICEIVVTYGISPLTEVLGFRKFRMANRYYGHLWNGYAIPGTENDEEYVYVTEDSEVYHRSRECTHLRLSVRRVEAAEIPKGYHPCEKCMVQKKDAAAPEENGYYICSEGECYHRRRDCPGLKRTVYCIARKDVDGYRECRKACCDQRKSVAGTDGKYLYERRKQAAKPVTGCGEIRDGRGTDQGTIYDRQSVGTGCQNGVA